MAAPERSVAEHVRTLDHVAVAVHDMAEAAGLFVDVLGATLLNGGDNDESGARLLQLSCAGSKIELMQPLRPDSVLARHLERRGSGFHHVTFMVDDLPETVDALEAAGYATAGTVVDDLYSESFLAPRQTFGALLQFVGTTLRFDVPASGYDLQDVLAGRVVWRDRVACLRGA